MVMVPGSNGEGGAFEMVAEHLAARYTVVTYDRRGFSRSQLDGPQDYEHRLETDADDVRRLIEHLSDEPATLFGASSARPAFPQVLPPPPPPARTPLPSHPPPLTPPPARPRRSDRAGGRAGIPRPSGLRGERGAGQEAFAGRDRAARRSPRLRGAPGRVRARAPAGSGADRARTRGVTSPMRRRTALVA